MFIAIQVGAAGLLKLCRSILLLGGIFGHSPLLVRRVRPSDNAPSGALWVVIDGNHQLFLFTHPYLLNIICRINNLTKQRDELPTELSDVEKAEILKYIKDMGGKFTILVTHESIPDEISNITICILQNIYTKNSF